MRPAWRDYAIGIGVPIVACGLLRLFVSPEWQTPVVLVSVVAVLMRASFVHGRASAMHRATLLQRERVKDALDRLGLEDHEP